MPPHFLLHRGCLGFECAHESSGDLIKLQLLPQYVGSGGCNCAFLISSPSGPTTHLECPGAGCDSCKKWAGIFTEASSVNYALPKEKERERENGCQRPKHRQRFGIRRTCPVCSRDATAVRVGVSHPGQRLGVQITFRQCHWNEPGCRWVIGPRGKVPRLSSTH